MVGPEVTVGMIVVGVIVLMAVLLFVFEPVSIDVTALGVMVVLIMLGPWTEISVEEGLSGFSNPATIAVLAMLILSEGIRKTGLIQRLIPRLQSFARDSLRRMLAAIVGIAGPVSGFVNNTPVVALLVPVVSDIAHRTRISPSKLLIPLSYAAMLGGMLTVIGTSTNLLASSVSERLLGHPLSMFEFIHLGLLVLVVGGLYLVFVAPHLLPERILPDETLFEEYDLSAYLTEVEVSTDSSFVGRTVGQMFRDRQLDLDVVHLVREDTVVREPLGSRVIHAGDTLVVRTNRETLFSLIESGDVELRSTEITELALDYDESDEWRLTELVIPSDSSLVQETLVSSRFRQQYDANVLAIRRSGKLLHDRLGRMPLHGGDVLLVQASQDSIYRLSRDSDFIVVGEVENPEYQRSKIPLAISIIAGVVLLPALEILPIVVTALLGVILMVATGVLKAHELYEAVEWRVIFLLAGIIPLGMALEQTGGAEWIGVLVANTSDYLPLLVVLWIFYISTGLITAFLSNNASVVLMIPIAIETAEQIGGNPFAFLLAVMFAASTAFMTPIGYQTNLFVYGPGGYKFSDFIRVGLPLQLVLSVATVGGIYMFWGI
jgi:di/tricarboxylate transporter